MIVFYYGMRSRGFSPGCQPMEGFLERQDDWTGKYWDIIVYDHELSRADCEHYDLEFVAAKRSTDYRI
jgi:hypothetical protein